jgi:tetratricopeptide (TPR) repeat protein
LEVKNPKELAAEGKSSYSSGKYQEAAQFYKAAADGYAAEGDNLIAAEMKNNQCVALLQTGDAEGALVAVSGTEEIFEAAEDTYRQAMAAGNMASALEALGNIEEAEHGYRRSADLLEGIGESELRANVMQSLSAMQLKAGRQLEALASMQAGVEDIKRPSIKQRLLKKLLNVPFNLLKKG